MKNKESFLVTGAAGFIGAEIVKRLLRNGEEVIGIDNLNTYYDPALKRSRLKEINIINQEFSGSWYFYEHSIEDEKIFKDISKLHSIKVVIHLAAQAGVRYSISHPRSYVKSNLVGFFNILEFCRENFVMG